MDLILDSIANGQRKQAWRYLIQGKKDFCDLMDHLEVDEIKGMIIVGIYNGYVKIEDNGEFD